MARYLSAEWLAAASSPDPLRQPVNLVLEEVVRDTPDGTVHYRVEVAGDQTRIVWPVTREAPSPDLRISTDWPTAVAVARGDISTQRALMEGRLRVSGDPGGIGDAAGTLAGVDPLPSQVRASTTYDDT